MTYISLIGKRKSTNNIPFMGKDFVYLYMVTKAMFNDRNYDWYLKEWLSALGVTNQYLQDETGWTQRITNQLINRKYRWNRDHLSLASSVLNLEPYELLLHPDEANEIKRIRQDYHRQIQIAAERRVEYRAAEGDDVKRVNE